MNFLLVNSFGIYAQNFANSVSVGELEIIDNTSKAIPRINLCH